MTDGFFPPVIHQSGVFLLDWILPLDAVSISIDYLMIRLGLVIIT